MPEPSKFKVGDVVREGSRAKDSAWIVAADDTNRTPVHDPEPAYKLSQVSAVCRGHNVPRTRTRYAYESQLRLATA